MIDFYFSFIDPYSYLAAPRALSIDQRYDVSLRLRPVEVDGLGSMRDRRTVHQLSDCRREAKRLRLAFGPLCVPTAASNREALIVVLGAQRRDPRLARELVLRIGRAVWAEAADISQRSTLCRIAGELGVSSGDLWAWLADRSLANELEGNRERLRADGHWSVPTLVFENEPFWGQDRIDAFESMLARAGLAGRRFQLEEAARSSSARPLASRLA